jgi:hypothetical protein
MSSRLDVTGSFVRFVGLLPSAYLDATGLITLQPESLDLQHLGDPPVLGLVLSLQASVFLGALRDEAELLNGWEPFVLAAGMDANMPIVGHAVRGAVVEVLAIGVGSEKIPDRPPCLDDLAALASRDVLRRKANCSVCEVGIEKGCYLIHGHTCGPWRWPPDQIVYARHGPEVEGWKSPAREPSPDDLAADDPSTARAVL